MIRPSVIFAAAAIALVTGCAKKPAAREVQTLEITAAQMMRPNVHIGDDLARMCEIHFDDVARAPRFDFDDAELQPEDREILIQVAKCLTMGALRGRSIALVGRADPRGDVEYNLALGGQRANGVKAYLARLGVDDGHMEETSRGELDAHGTEEEGWRRDRRVDLVLK